MAGYTEESVSRPSKLVQPVLSFADGKARIKEGNAGSMDRVSIRSAFSY